MQAKTLTRTAVLLSVLVAIAGCSSTPSRESTGELVDNSLITTKVKTQLALSSETSALAVHVESFKNTVLLSGFVDSEAEKQAAEEIATNVNGVENVENALVVKQ